MDELTSISKRENLQFNNFDLHDYCLKFGIHEKRHQQIELVNLDKKNKDKSKKLQNIGEVGISIDFSNNTLRNPIQDDFPLADWLLNTSASQMMAQARRNGNLVFRTNPQTGAKEVLLPFTVYTTEPEDTTGACCWVPLDIAKCGGTAPINLLCLKDCEDILEDFLLQEQRGKSTDLTGYFLRQGETIKDARRRMARISMAFFTARNLILGTTTTETPTLKQFHGLLEVMNNPAVLSYSGVNILSAFNQLWCRLEVLGEGSYVFWAHPLIISAIDEVIVGGRFNELPRGWNRDTNGNLSFHNITFRADKHVPFDLETGTGEGWLIDGNYTGALMGTGLYITDRKFIKETFVTNDNREEGCAEVCDFYYNYGTVFNTNPNRLMKIVDIPMSTSCAGSTLAGLEGLVNPDTLVPFDEMLG